MLGWSAAKDGTALLPGQAAALAAALARLLDMAASEEASFDRLRELAPAEFAEHWQLVLDFLEILPRCGRRSSRRRARSTRPSGATGCCGGKPRLWREAPPRAPVIAAGLMGGMPALTELLSRGRLARPGRGDPPRARPRPRAPNDGS